MYDDAGEKIWSCELDIYGKVRRQDLLGERTACPFRYPGQYEDEETGLYYNRFRYYSPHEGIYTQQDPIGLEGGIQLYGYVHDPNTWVDVFGLVSTNTLKGDAAELAYENVLKKYGYNIFMTIKNNSNHGTDIIAQHPHTKKILIFEVKANSSRLSKKQKGQNYIKEIFNEIMRRGKLRGQPVDAKMQNLVVDIAKSIKDYGMSSYEVRYTVDNALNATYETTKKWCQARP
ncbi:RHS repeat-associated core domain-containing protein [Paenibacillus ehimensis]